MQQLNRVRLVRSFVYTKCVRLQHELFESNLPAVGQPGDAVVHSCCTRSSLPAGRLPQAAVNTHIHRYTLHTCVYVGIHCTGNVGEQDTSAIANEF